jgi:hypothetical protein
MSLTKLSLAVNNLIIPARDIWLVTSRLVTGKLLTFYRVYALDFYLDLASIYGSSMQVYRFLEQEKSFLNLIKKGKI